MKCICDIVIPVWNSPDWLEICIEAVVRSDISECIQNIILVDDCSNEKTKQCIQKILKSYTKTKLFTNDENLGFVKTCNRGMEETSAEYIMLLNSDCLLAEDSIKKMILCIEHDTRIGLVCPLSNNAANLSVEIPKGLDYIKFDRLLGEKFVKEIFDACTIVGNCIIISRECYKKVGALDEAYGMGYGEETDYQFKAQEIGFRAVVSVDTYVFHKSQMSFGDSEQLNEQKHKNVKLFFSRWGYEYQECMKKYVNNEPVSYIKKNITLEEIKRLANYKTKAFPDEFLERLKNIDNKYSKVLFENKRIQKTNSLGKNQGLRKLIRLFGTTKVVFREEGVLICIKRVFRYLSGKDPYSDKKAINEAVSQGINSTYNGPNFKDLLFIIEYDSFSSRYRVDHTIEQLSFNGMYCDVAHTDHLTIELLKYYRGIVIYRCQLTDKLEYFIMQAKMCNKMVFYDIDDLIFEYDSIKDMKFLKLEEYKDFKDYTEKIKNCIKLSDAVITSTVTLKNELQKLNSNVYVNRNVASEMMVEVSLKEIENKKRNTQKIVLGYFSGTKTHDADFALISSAILRVMEENENVYLKIVGYLVLDIRFDIYKSRISKYEFVDWRDLPGLIASVDINLMPLENTLFCKAKSENKWTESALVKVVTVMSINEELSSIVDNGKTGFLCRSEKDWYETLSMLVKDKGLLEIVGENAFNEAYFHHTTAYTGYGITKYFRKMLKPCIAFFVPGIGVCGGINVVLRHCEILRRSGNDTFLINKGDDLTTCQCNGSLFFVLPGKANYLGYIEKVVATMWNTNTLIDRLWNYKRRYYLIQGLEMEFYSQAESQLKQAASATYSLDGVNYITISKWCENWLRNNFDRDPVYVPNGIDINQFHVVSRNYSKKIRIIIEGDPNSPWKNVDESFRIANRLSKEKYEIIFLSYASQPKPWYQIDEFYNLVPYDKVAKIYEGCHILLKSSELESFSYPPIEMMATGGLVVAIQNSGNAEYMNDNYNCLIYKQHNIDEAIEKIKLLVENEEMRKRLIENGLKTVNERNWNDIAYVINKAYE